MVRSFRHRSGLFASVDCSSWSDFRENLGSVLGMAVGKGNVSEGYIFRGQSCSSWGLTSSFTRRFQSLSPAERDGRYSAMMKMFYENFEVYGGLGRSLESIDAEKFRAYTDAEKEAVAQHYGLGTRLLDWSFSPYVAAFFSGSRVDLNSSGSVSIWALRRSAFDIFSSRELELVRDYNSGNVRNLWQMGAFTRNHTAQTDTAELFKKKSASYDHKLDAGQPMLVRFDVPVASLSEMEEDLQMMRINSMTIFPGMFGVVDWIKKKAGF